MEQICIFYEDPLLDLTCGQDPPLDLIFEGLKASRRKAPYREVPHGRNIFSKMMIQE